MEYASCQHSAHRRSSATLSAFVFALVIVAMEHTQAEPYLPIYHDATSADILPLENDVAFRFPPDIDGDGRPETLTVWKGQRCNAGVIHRSSYRSDGVHSTSDAAGHWRLFESGDGCGLAGRTDVIGDANGDGRRDLLYTVHEYESDIDKTGLIFTPASSDEIDIAGLDGSSGFLLEGRLFVRDAGDVNGDGYDDFIVDAHHVIAGAAGFAAQYSSSTLPDGLLVDSRLHGDGFTRVGDLDGDGFVDLVEIDNYRMYLTDSEILEQLGSVQLALRGKPRELDDQGPDGHVAEQIDSGWHVRWQSPGNGTPVG